MYVYRMQVTHATGARQFKWETGRITEDGRWEHESVHTTAREAAQRAAFLNSGGQDFNETSTQERTQ